MPVLPIRCDHAEPALARRFDIGTGDLLRMVKRDTDGTLHMEGIPVREGILVYRTADGTERRELVTAEAVRDTMTGCVRAAVTLEHPVNDAGEAVFVDPDNMSKYLVGDVGETVETVEEPILGGFGKLRVTARRRDALDAIGTGEAVELSPGYGVTLDETPGEHAVHGRYDARQIGRAVNHLAIVPKGRGGPTVRLRTDSFDAVQIGRQTPSAPMRTDSEAPPMKPNLCALLTLLGVARLDDEGAAIQAGTDAVKSLQTNAAKRADAEEGAAKSEEDLAALKAENAKLKEDMVGMKKEMDAAKAKADEFELAAKKKEDAADLARLTDTADRLGVNTDGLDLPALRKAIALTRVDSVDGKSADYIAALVDAAVKDATRTDDGASRWDFTDRSEPADPTKRGQPQRIVSHLDRADAALKTAEITAGGAK